jgi:hypothetical protein
MAYNIVTANESFLGARSMAKVSWGEQWLFYGQMTIEYMGWPLFLLVLGGVVAALVMRDRIDLIILVFPVLTYVAVTWTDSAFMRSSRYVLPAFPFLIVLAARLLVRLVTWLRDIRLKAILGVGALMAVLGTQSLASMELARGFTSPGTPMECRFWVEENIPEGSRILIQGFEGTSDDRRICPLYDLTANMLKFAQELQERSSMGAKLVRMRAGIPRAKRYDLAIIKPTDPWPTVKEARDAGVDYVISGIYSSEGRDKPMRDFEQTRYDFYHEMTNAENGRLLKKILPSLQRPDGASLRTSQIAIFKMKP